MFKTKLFQLAFPAYLICIHMVLCLIPAEGMLKDPNIMDNSLDITSYYHLYNMRSKMHVEIIGQIPYANAVKATNYTKLEVKSRRMGSTKTGNAGQVALTLMGKQAGRFLCFSKKGKLITRFSWSHPNCLFEEELTPDAYIEFHLLDKPSWKLSFNRRGKPIKATSQPMRHAENCVKFIKLGKNIASPETVKTGPVNSSEVLAESMRKKKTEMSPQEKMKPSRSRMYRRRRRGTTPKAEAVLGPLQDPQTSPAPLLRVRRQNQHVLRTLRLLKLLE